MRQILLNGVNYKVIGDTLKRAIFPWKAQIRQTGGREYSDFSQAELEEYFDFRNGIGKNRGLGSEARLEFSEGIDFAIEGQTVLGPLVNTAGTFGVAPVKIIDFQGATYAIGHNQISKWNTGTEAWDSKDTSLANPLDAVVVTDSTDEYLIVSSATEAIYTTDGTTWTVSVISREDFTTYTEEDTSARLTVTAPKALAVDVDSDMNVYLYRDMGAGFFDNLKVDFEIYLVLQSQGNSQAGMAISNTVGTINDFASTDISCVIKKVGTDATIYLYRGNVVASDSYTGSVDTPYYCTLERGTGNDNVYLKIYSDAGRTSLLDTLSVADFGTTTYRYVYGFVNRNTATGGQDFDGYVQNLNLRIFTGYLAEYDNRLYSISTDGQTIGYSTAKDIDSFAGSFELTGNFGTVYRLFEGKLLSDGTPALYFCGTRGLFTLDTTNEKAYKQEVSYPPLTNAGNVGIYWNANVWVATGYGILKVSPSTATFVGPDQDDGLPATYQGKIYDFATVNNWLWFCVNGGSTDKSSILKRNSSLGGNIQVYTTSASNTPIACIHHSPSSLYTNGRLWFGEDTSVKYMMAPDTTHNVKQISSYEYVNGSGYGKLPILRKLAMISKTALGVAAVTKSLNANEKIEVFYGLNGAAPTTSLGTFTSSPLPTKLTFNSGLGTVYYTIQFAIKLFRGSSGGNPERNSPELESLIFYYMAIPATISGWILNIEALGDEADRIFTEFEAIRDTNTLVVFYPSGDPDKTSYNVKLTTMPSREWWEEQGGREGRFQISIEEIFNG